MSNGVICTLTITNLPTAKKLVEDASGFKAKFAGGCCNIIRDRQQIRTIENKNTVYRCEKRSFKQGELDNITVDHEYDEMTVHFEWSEHNEKYWAARLKYQFGVLLNEEMRDLIEAMSVLNHCQLTPIK